ncbi:MAG: OmpA family protein [Thermomonas sp.]|uniref:OmpA family protein n=1 Tax=Thermomonas sp. TaxID=1971895 RepID=UPI0039E56389
MQTSFAHSRTSRLARFATLYAATVLLVTACASLPPPTAELESAAQAVSRAEAADADQYAPAELQRARSALQRAQDAMARKRADEAREAALAAAAEADLARVRSSAERTGAELRQRQAEVAGLRSRLQLDAGAEPQNPLDIPVPALPAEQRMQALDADNRLNPFAQYERLQARQALATLAAARRSALAAALAQAERRVGIAEQAARVEAARREIERQERERAELLVEASRRDADRARAEAERLRIEAQIQAEEAARLRAQAEQAEAVLDSAQIDRSAQVAAAREKEAALARKEAELVAGASLPPARRDERGDVFTLAGDAFASGQAQLTAKAAASVKALGIYLAALPGGAVQVIGHTDSQGEEAANQSLSERRAQAVRAALVQAGLARDRSSAQGMGEAQPVADNTTAAGRAKNRRVEIIVADNP